MPPVRSRCASPGGGLSGERRDHETLGPDRPGDDGNLGARPDRLRGAEDGGGGLRDGGAVRRRAGHHRGAVLRRVRRSEGATCRGCAQIRFPGRLRGGFRPRGLRGLALPDRCGRRCVHAAHGGLPDGPDDGRPGPHAAALPLAGRQQELPHREQTVPSAAPSGARRSANAPPHGRRRSSTRNNGAASARARAPPDSGPAPDGAPARAAARQLARGRGRARVHLPHARRRTLLG